MIPIRKRFARVIAPGCFGTMLLLLLFGWCGVSEADQVILHDGKIIEGTIISESETRVTIDVDTIRITLMRKEIKEIKKGDQLFGVVEQQAQPDKPTTDSGVLPALRQTAAAESAKATFPPTNTPQPTDTPTDTVAPQASDTPTIQPISAATNTPTFTAVAQATSTPTFTVKPALTSTPTFTEVPPKATEPPTKKPEPQATNTPVLEPTKPAVQPTVPKPTQQPVAVKPEPTSKPLVSVDASSLPQGEAYIVARDFINVRNGPSPNDEQLGKLYKNAILIVNAKADSGYLRFKALESADEGWAHGNLLAKIPDTPVLVTARRVNFRKGPGTTHIRIGELQEGEVGRILERQNNWIRIRTTDNRVGWVSASYVTPVGTP